MTVSGAAEAIVSNSSTVAEGHLLFKAYVDDVAARRGCTGLKLPSDFTP